MGLEIFCKKNITFKTSYKTQDDGVLVDLEVIAYYLFVKGHLYEKC